MCFSLVGEGDIISWTLSWRRSHLNWALKHREAFQGGGGLGGHGKGILREHCKSRTGWASNAHWFRLVPDTMVKNKQKWRCAPSVGKRQDQHPGTELPHLAFHEVPHCCAEAVRVERKIELDGTL